MLQHEFKRGATYNNLYIKSKNESVLIVVVYLYDIIFGSDAYALTQNFVTDMRVVFEMSMLG